MPASVVIDRAPTQQHATNGQHGPAGGAGEHPMADVYCSGLDLAAASAILQSAGAAQPPRSAVAGFPSPHQLALDLAKFAAASSLSNGCAVADCSSSSASNGTVMPTVLSSSSSSSSPGSDAGNTSPVMQVCPTVRVLSPGAVPDMTGGCSTMSVNGACRKSANMTECVPVPSSEHVAEIVGRQGSKIKALRAKTNTYIKTPVRGEEPVFVVTGRREDVAAAKREILSASEHFSQIRASRLNAASNPGGVNSAAPRLSGGPQGPTQDTGGQVTIHVRVPYRVVGLVVGPKGATIKRIQQDSATYIVTPSRDREPVFEVTGTGEGVEKARRDIESYIALRTGSCTTTPCSPGADCTSLVSSAGAVHNNQGQVDPRILLNSLLKSGGGPAVMPGSGGMGASMLALNNAVNMHRQHQPPHRLTHQDLLSNNAPPHALHAAASLAGGAFKHYGAAELDPAPPGQLPGPGRMSTYPLYAGGGGGLFDFDLGPPSFCDNHISHQLLVNNNNSKLMCAGLDNQHSSVGLGSAGGDIGGTWPPPVSSMDLSRLAASLLPLSSSTSPPGGDHDHLNTAGIGGPMLDLDLLGGYTHPAVAAALVGGDTGCQSMPHQHHAFYHPDLAAVGRSSAFLSASSESGLSLGSGSSPPGTASPPGPTESPRRATAGLLELPQGGGGGGGGCLLCGDGNVSAALVPCGHNMFCKLCADGVVSRPDVVDRRCPVCSQPASLAITIIS